VLAAILLSFPLSASALGINVTNVSSSGASTAVLQVGDILTIDAVVTNPTAVEIWGLGLLVNGYDEDRNGIADSGLVYDSGAVTGGMFTQLIDPTLGPLGQIDNVRTEPEEQWNFDPFDHEALRLSIFDGATLSPSSANTGLDTGVDGALINTGDVHFRVSFRATSLGSAPPSAFTLTLGVDPEYGAVAVGANGATLPFVNDTVYLQVVPEPGTALLFGLGLAGLASTRRR
jgi:hypothetical protein